MQAYGAKHIIITDSKGAIHSARNDLNQYKTPRIATNLNDQAGTLAEVLVDADVFVGVSRPNLISSNEVRTMAKDPIIFALSNPEPEIMPDEAYA